MLSRIITTLGLSLALLSQAHAHEYTLGTLKIGHPYARATVAGQPSAGAYLSIENKGAATDKLVSAATEAAKTTEIHTMSMEGDIMKMRRIDGIDIQPGETITMQPGNGYHLMLIGLKKPLAAGESIPMTLVFEKAGKIDVSVKVETIKAGGHNTAHKH